jgi:hypothetical protein
VVQLAKRLAVQIPCEYVLVVPNYDPDSTSTAAPFVVSGAEAASVEKKSQREKVARRHASNSESCPVGMCIHHRKVVEVRNMLLEERFGKACKDKEKIFSAICVPVMEERAALNGGRRKSTGPILSLDDMVELPASEQRKVLAVLKCINKIDFVRQMAGIPFNDDDVRLAAVLAENIADTIQVSSSNMLLTSMAVSSEDHLHI